MAVSRECEECNLVKRCRMHLDRGGTVTYLCRPCARELGFDPGVPSVGVTLDTPATDAKEPVGATVRGVRGG